MKRTIFILGVLYKNTYWQNDYLFFMKGKKVKNMKKTMKILLFSLLFMVLSNGVSQASELNFSVLPVIPENQQDKDKTYFDIKLAPLEQQELKVRLKNDTDKEVIVETTLNRARTNLNGVVEYGKTNDENDDLVVYNLEDYVDITDKETAIPANGEKELTLKVISPNEAFDGILVGGLTFKEKSADSKKEKPTGQGLAIKNEYAYVVGLVMHGTDTPVESLVNLLKVEAAQVNARNVINATLQNPKPDYLNQMKVDAKITKKGSKNVLYTSKSEDMQMAPNSNFSYPIALSGQPLKAGKYTMSMRVDSGENHWEFTKDFEIKKEIADKYNAQDVSIEKSYTWIYMIVGFMFILLIGIIFLLLHKQKKTKK